ncbi:MAG TPA: META domain-containing protein [Flavipsychrobacter sp.]|nr:META domain-containing protein [Flavipsychrobacter sp.]
MKRIIFVLLSIALFTACNRKMAQSQSASASYSLTGTRWKLVALNTMTDGLPVLNRDAFLRIDSNKVSGFTGCNSYFGTYTTNDSLIHFGPIGGTKLFCSNIMKVESGLYNTFRNADHYKIDNKQLILFEKDQWLARFIAQ